MIETLRIKSTFCDQRLNFEIKVIVVGKVEMSRIKLKGFAHRFRQFPVYFDFINGISGSQN